MDPRSDLFKINLNRMTFAELRRHAPSRIAAGIYWLTGRFGLLKSPMPIVYQARRFTQTAVDLEVLTYETIAALRPYLEGFERLGYSPAHYVRLDEGADPTLADSGGCYLLHATGASFVLVAHLQKWRAPAYRVADSHTVTWVGAGFSSGSKVAVTDTAAHLDVVPPARVIVLPGATPAEMHRAVRAEIDARAAIDPVVVVDGPQQLAEIIQREEDRTTKARIARGLYAPMTEQELAAARDRVTRARSAAS